jgi:hypothetical protein
MGMEFIMKSMTRGKKRLKKALSAVLILQMLMSILPVTAFADLTANEPVPDAQTETAENDISVEPYAV